MADQMTTRFGILYRDVANALLETVALAARDGVQALDGAHRRLGLKSNVDGLLTLPSERWNNFLRDLFPGMTILIDPAAVPSRDVAGLQTSQEDEHVIRRMLAATASFLLTESVKLDEQLELWAQIEEPGDAGLASVRTMVECAANTSYLLLDHAEDGTWRELARAPRVQPAEDDLVVDLPAVSVRTGPPDRTDLARTLVFVVFHEQDRNLADTLSRHILTMAAPERAVALSSLWSDATSASEQESSSLGQQTLLFNDLNVRYVVTDDPRPGHGPGTETRPAAGARTDLDLVHVLNALTRTEKPDLVVVVSTWKPRDDDPELVAAQLESRGRLPMLRGTTVVLAGDSGETLVNYWRAICSAAGARSFMVSKEEPAKRRELEPFVPRPNVSASTHKTRDYLLGSWAVTIRAAMILVIGTVMVLTAVVALSHVDPSSLWPLIGVAGGAVAIANRPSRFRRRYRPKDSRPEATGPSPLLQKVF